MNKNTSGGGLLRWIKMSGILLLFSLMIPLKINAKTMPEYMLDAVKNNNWEIISENKQFYDIKILVGNINEDSDLKAAYETQKGWFGSMTGEIMIETCSQGNKSKCSTDLDKTGNESPVFFELQKVDDNGNLYIRDSNAYISTVTTIKNHKYNYYEASANGFDDIKGDLTTIKYFNTSQSTTSAPKGSSQNPIIIKKNTSFNFFKKDDSFWDSYDRIYLKFEVPNAKDGTGIGRYYIKVDGAKVNNIEIYAVQANGSESSVLNDAVDNDLYGFSSTTYYIYKNKNLYGKKITFAFQDNKNLVVSNTNNPTANKAEELYGEENIDLQSDKDITKAHDALAGAFSPDTLCGENNENCNIDITKFCTTPSVARTLKFLGLLLYIAKILVPAIIIVLGFVDLVKIVTSGKVEEAKKQATNIFRRVGIGVIIFLIPTILITIYNVANRIASGVDENDEVSSELEAPENFQNCIYCILDPGKCLVTIENMEE